MKKLVIVGAGGLGREVAQYVEDINAKEPTFELMGYIDTDLSKKGTQYLDVTVLGDMDVIPILIAAHGTIYGICAIANVKIRQRVVEEMKTDGIIFANMIHPTAYVGHTVTIGCGTLIGPYAVLTTHITIGDHVLINPQCGIGHDTRIDDFTTLYWNVNVSGFVHIANQVEIGSKAFIKQAITVGTHSIIGAGAVVVKDVQPHTTVKGVPARAEVG